MGEYLVRNGRVAQWSETAKSRDVSTGPLARLFAHSLAPLTHLLAPHCLLRPFARTAHSLTPELVGK